MNDEGQQELWPSDDGDTRRAARDRARDLWQAERRHHGVGSAEEAEAWQAYRALSDQLWQESRGRP